MFLALLWLWTIEVTGCSDFQIKSTDNSLIYARAMDFIMPLESQIEIFNKDHDECSSSPNGDVGICWTSKYGFVGINAFDVPLVTEGMNHKGLTCGYLVMNNTTYPTINPNDYNKSLSVTDFCMWALGLYSNVNDIKLMLDNGLVRVWGNKVPVLNIIMKLHIALHDASGNNLVIEFIDGATILYDNKLGILTNEPPLQFHLTNLGLYNRLNPVTSEGAIINGEIIPTIAGSGLDSIPGGWSPISRFVRIAVLLRYIRGIQTAQDAITAASWILNSVYVPNGIEIGVFNNHKVIASTKWGTIKDVTNMKFYFRGDDGVLRSLNLNKIDFSNNTKHKRYIVRQPPFSIDVTSSLSN